MSMMKRYQQLYGVHDQRSYARGGMKTGRRRSSAPGRHHGPGGPSSYGVTSVAVGDVGSELGGLCRIAAPGMVDGRRWVCKLKRRL